MKRAGAVTVVVAAACLAPPPVTSSSFITSYSNEDGLPQVTAYDVVTDDRGYLLIGTQDGLARFDGYRFESFRRDRADPDSLAGHQVKRLARDDTGRVWIATGGGVNVYAGGSGELARFDRAFGRAVVDLAPDPQGRVWIATEDGLFIADPDSKRISAPPAAFSPAGAITALACDDAGVLWIGTKGGLYRLGAGGGARLFADSTTSPSLKSDRLVELYVDGTDALWIGYEEAGFSVLDRDRQTIAHGLTHPLFDELDDETVYAFLKDREGRLWIGGFGGAGVLRWDPQTRTARQFRASIGGEGLRNDQVLSFYEDFAGSVWIGTVAGLSRLDPAKEGFGNISFGPRTGGLSERVVTAVFEDESGRLWIGTFGGGLNRYDDQSGRVSVIRTQPSDFVIALEQAAEGRLWVGTTRGLGRYDPGTGVTETFRPGDGSGLAAERVEDLRRDRGGRLWLLVDGRVQLHEPDTGRFCTPIEGVGHVEHLFHQSDRTWLVDGDGGSHGLSLAGPGCRDARLQAITSPAVPRHVEPLLEDSRGDVWVASPDGLGRLSPDLETFTPVEGLPSSIVYGALEDAAGNVWVSTNRGLARIAHSDGSIETYTIADGLQSDEFSGEDALRRANGQLVFAGINGVNVFDPAGLVRNRVPPIVHLTSLRLYQSAESAAEAGRGGTPMPVGPEFSLAGGQYGFEVGFTALHYLEPAANRYQYRLDGLDRDWIDAGVSQRFARYTNLQPGSYTLRVRAANAHGVWSQTEATVAITVHPAWWQTPLARAAAMAALIGLVLAIIRWRTLALRRRTAELEQQVRARTRDIARQRDVIQRQIEELRTLDQAKERFFEDISHEFRTPLTLIIGPLRRMLDDPLPAAVKEKIDLAVRNAARLLRLINELLDLSRLNSGLLKLHPKSYPLAADLRRIVSPLAAAARDKGLDVALRLDDDVVLRYDARAMEKIVTNLVSNAVKFTPAGGRIGVEAWSEDDGRTLIRVSDSGPGIAPEEQARVFERFRRSGAGDRIQGSGIGLSLVKDLVELHGATIELDSAAGSGSRFTVAFPPGDVDAAPEDLPELDEFGTVRLAGEAAPVSGRAAHVERPDAIAYEHTILIVDDEPDMRSYLAEVLDGYRLLTAGDGKRGLELAVGEIPDLIVSDVMMPEMDGLEMSHAVREREETSHIPLILLSAKGGDRSMRDGLKEGAIDYLVKPVDEHVLRLKIESLIGWRDRLARRLGSADLTGDLSELPASERPFFARLSRVLEENFSDPEFGPADLARRLSITPRTLQRKLRAVVGQTPGEYLRNFRLHKAAAMRRRGLSVTETSEASGFSSMAVFSRAFKDRFDVPPSHFPDQVD